MSVICQNFVQNAWKKDLCSNCFKSVGDHEMGEHGLGHDQVQPNPPAQLKIAYVSQASSGSSCNNNSTPHTTWKSLISERNTKNSQPFKLETGFQGRLLTINKAANGTERNGFRNGKFKNGHASDSEIVSDDSSKHINGSVKMTGFSQLKKGKQFSNGYAAVNKNTNNLEANGKMSKNESDENCLKRAEKTSNGNNGFSQSKLMKSRSEDSLSTPLHSILKKNVSIPLNNNSPSRRGSNVGFKDEEPLVIGYGGRDFSPEDLAWDMNTSDGEIEPTSDSLDESEDDKAFSKMTQQNTEYNSDNTNLLKKEKPVANTDEKARKPTQQFEVICTDISSAALTKTESSTFNVQNTRTSQSITTQEVEASTHQIRSTMDANKVKNSGQTNESHSPLLNCSRSENGAVELEMQTAKCPENDLINAPLTTKEEEAASVMMTSGEVTVVEAAARSRTGAKNNSGIAPEEAVTPSPSRAIPSRNPENNRVMFTDGEERAPTDPLPDENNAWQEDENVAGQILQAINTSLTNRHKMNETPSSAVDASLMLKTLPSENGEEKKSEDSASQISTHEIPNCDEKLSSSDEDTAENELNVEPRKSFLHGLTSTHTSTKPSAIYGPASDLFVSRSDSSSSSSSDEFQKSKNSHSVVVKNKNTRPLSINENMDTTEDEVEETNPHQAFVKEHENNCLITIKSKPKIPAKPLKQPAARPPTSKIYAKNKSMESVSCSDSTKSSNSPHYAAANATLYSEGPQSITLVDHYAESNIYHEVGDIESRTSDSDQGDKLPRETKLAALAMELEQVRCCNGITKRQAPAPPPKIPDPPTEDPPTSLDRTSSPLTPDAPHGFSSFRGEALGFSSSSSTASTSSQDTETGYASWNLHGGESDDQRRHSKSKSSFLLTQYSKCKMFAKECAEDSARSRKRFSLKKLLKMKKDGSGDNSSAFDPSCPNPKAWKYSDQFERPRAKLEIIHPMDLENKSVTVNPGFDSMQSGSMSSFSATSADEVSTRNSMSSDYGSFYSDTIAIANELKQDVNFDALPPPIPPPPDEQEFADHDKSAPCSSDSPTPSRTSSVSETSTMTSGSSRNEGTACRPPKPPPPPRAHSLLPGNKTLNPDGTFKFPVVNCNSVSGMEVLPPSPTKPQAPKRHAKPPSLQRFECGIYDNTGLLSTPEEVELSLETIPPRNTYSVEENQYGTILDIRVNSSETNSEPKLLEPTCASASDSSEKKEVPSVAGPKFESQSINVTVKTNVTDPNKKSTTSAVIGRCKNGPVTKAPARPPPIYMKSQMSNIVKNPNPWKTLEDSYLTLTTSNRELLAKLVNQALKKRRDFLVTLQKIKFQWTEFEIDVDQPSSVFAFGEKIAYHATMPRFPDYAVTLVITVQQQHNRLNENNDLKYPVFGQFVDFIPKKLWENSTDIEIDSMQATILVLDRSNISTIECFAENLPDSFSEDSEKELCYIVLQLIHSLKSLQAQGIESIDSSFHNLILAKRKNDKFNTLVFLYDNCFEENDYLSDSCKISLCQYTLMLLCQMLGIQSLEEFALISASRFSSKMAKSVFETAISLLSEEKAVSLSQTKTLFECFLWDVTKVIGSIQDSDDVDSILQRWLDIKRANYIKRIFEDNSQCDITVMSEYFSQFLMRSSIRNIKEVLSYL